MSYGIELSNRRIRKAETNSPGMLCWITGIKAASEEQETTVLPALTKTS